MSRELFTELPSIGAWRLLGAYEGHEVVRFTTNDSEVVLEGTTVGVEGKLPWSIHYLIKATSDWRVRYAAATDDSGATLEIATDGNGLWQVNGQPAPELDGCLDVDFEASTVTNTIPVHRLSLSAGQQGESAAAYVRTKGLTVERLEQSYLRLADKGGEILFGYASPHFNYRDTLHFGQDGLATKYPGIGERMVLNS